MKLVRPTSYYLYYLILFDIEKHVLPCQFCVFGLHGRITWTDSGDLELIQFLKQKIKGNFQSYSTTRTSWHEKVRSIFESDPVF